MWEVSEVLMHVTIKGLAHAEKVATEVLEHVAAIKTLLSSSSWTGISTDLVLTDETKEKADSGN